MGASRQTSTYDFPRIGVEIVLERQVPSRLIEAETSSHRSGVEWDSTLSGRFRSGMSLWDASFVLAELLSKHYDLLQVAEVQELMGEKVKIWNSLKGKRGVEIGAGLGLPSIVAANLGAKMTGS